MTLNVLDVLLRPLLQILLKKIHDIVLDDRRMNVHKIASAIGISIERVHNHLGRNKLFAR